MPKRVAENEWASRLDALKAASNYRARSEIERKTSNSPNTSCRFSYEQCEVVCVKIAPFNSDDTGSILVRNKRRKLLFLCDDVERERNTDRQAPEIDDKPFYPGEPHKNWPVPQCR